MAPPEDMPKPEIIYHQLDGLHLDTFEFAVPLLHLENVRRQMKSSGLNPYKVEAFLDTAYRCKDKLKEMDVKLSIITEKLHAIQLSKR